MDIVLSELLMMEKQLIFFWFRKLTYFLSSHIYIATNNIIILKNFIIRSYIKCNRENKKGNWLSNAQLSTSAHVQLHHQIRLRSSAMVLEHTLIVSPLAAEILWFNSAPEGFKDGWRLGIYPGIER